MSDTLVERLRDWMAVWPEDDGKPEGSLFIEAADRIEELEAKLARPREARMGRWDEMMNPAREALEALIAEGDAMADLIEELEAKLASLIAVAEAVLEEWDRGDEAAFREVIEEMRADVAAAKGEKETGR